MRDAAPPTPIASTFGTQAQREPPQQLAAHHGHPWYDAFWAPRVRVLVNGIERMRVVVADGPGRYVEIIDEPMRQEGNHLKTVRSEGDVVIVRKEAGADG